ncbi:MAG: sulfotransferase family 2 domain-containing protein [Acidimicrobiia bacterium]|nr:sulfotransferase family 2 domain-containing protein [Acidimicrobiia bacterium]
MTDTQRFLFIHVMKTAGATFRQHLRHTFDPAERYPNPELETVPAVEFNLLVDYVSGLPAERRQAIRSYAGHFPYLLAARLPQPVRTYTILRDPVDRVLSYLKQRRGELGASSLDEVYDDEFTRQTLLDNHQVKVFSLTEDDRPESIMDIVRLDDDRLQAACANLDRIDVVGVTERYPEFCAQIERQFGWTLGPVPDRRVAEPVDVSDSLRARIAVDNTLDLELHRYATSLVDARDRSIPATRGS